MGNAAPRAAAATTPDAPERRLAEDLRHAVVVARLGRGRVLTSLRCRAGGAALVLKVHLPRARTKALGTGAVPGMHSTPYFSTARPLARVWMSESLHHAPPRPLGTWWRCTCTVYVCEECLVC